MPRKRSQNIVAEPQAKTDISDSSAASDLSPEDILRCLICGETPFTGEIIDSGPLLDSRVRKALILALDALLALDPLEAQESAELVPLQEVMVSPVEGSAVLKPWQLKVGQFLEPPALKESVLETELFWRQGYNPNQVAELRGLKLPTIYSHLGQLAQAKRVISHEVVSEEVEREILEDAIHTSEELTVFEFARQSGGRYRAVEVIFVLTSHGFPVLFSKPTP